LKNFRPFASRIQTIDRADWHKSLKISTVVNGTTIALKQVPVMYGQLGTSQRAKTTPGARHEQLPMSGPQKGRASREA
jgi:hypothetical protein